MILAAFKNINLYDTATAVRGTQQSTQSGTTIPQIGRAKSRGFEYLAVAGSETDDIFATS